MILTLFTNESGQILHKTSHPFKFDAMGTTTIQKIVLNVDPADTHDQFEVMGEIEWRVRIVDVPHQRLSNTVQWFPPSAWDLGTVCGILGNHLAESVVLMFAQRAPLSKWTFKEPDGRPYRWDLQFRVVVGTTDARINHACSCFGTADQKRRLQDITGDRSALSNPKGSLRLSRCRFWCDGHAGLNYPYVCLRGEIAWGQRTSYPALLVVDHEGLEGGANTRFLLITLALFGNSSSCSFIHGFCMMYWQGGRETTHSQ
ncbi:hypothetical protein JVT61DRAFT_2836 [Boletus reticuloceps]|uniref:DUF6593 domain-containing protein n=1 Tax=Boletus reticuloceps TaxID=495285 RepID=A0A8I2YPQ7_9AGAM|nr:hypothetical protein JVT61DRAFT_2836 [Boletus reticuloceps]